MDEAGLESEAGGDGAPRRRALGALIAGLWVAALVVQALAVISRPNESTVIQLTVLAALFVAVYAQFGLMRIARVRSMRALAMRLRSRAYISETTNMPNRNYLLAQIRSEAAASRLRRRPFVLLLLSLDDLEAVARRRGQGFVDRALMAMADFLDRTVRDSDFAAHVAGEEFAVLLHDCTLEQSGNFLGRIPPTLAVGDGRRVLELPITVRAYEYDMEAIHATDVLFAAEESPRLVRETEEVHWAVVA
jgi:GGDEF domain-containing protein